MKELKREIAESCSDNMGLDELSRLRFMEAVLKEGLRMYPPVVNGLPRIAARGGVMVGDHLVPQGTTMSVQHYSSYRYETNFKHPDTYRPERWLGNPEFKDDNLAALEPFSVGPRSCIGKVCELEMFLPGTKLTCC